MQKADLKQDYLNGADALRAFYEYSFPVKDPAKLVQDRSSYPVNRQILVKELLKQNEFLPDNTATLANIQALAEKDTFTVTTGHQLCLMGGPLYMLFKIATAIRLSQDWNKRLPEQKIVPIFWMASEDHDWEEINHFYTGFDEKVIYPGTFKGPVGHHILENSITETLNGKVASELAAFFQPGRTLAEAFRRFIHHLFGQEGLVIIDADSAALKRMAIPLMQTEIGNGIGSEIEKTDEKRSELAYHNQIRPQAVSLFYIGHGGRSPIVLRAIDSHPDAISEEHEREIYTSKDGALKCSAQELREMIAVKPEAFSPNVALRPLYQEIILPNLAYVGGWAEVSYWMQIKSAAQASKVFFPLLVPRMSAGLLLETQAQEWSELGFDTADLSLPIHELNERYLLKDWDPGPLEKAAKAVLSAFQALTEVVDNIDPPLANGVRAEQKKTHKSAENLQKKVRKSLRNRNPKPYARILALKAAIQPEHKQQQRILSIAAFGHIRPLECIEIILKNCQPEEYEDKWIQIP